MALIKCEECGKEISDNAGVCPHCGNPIKPVEIEATSKKWKVVKIISWSAFIIGILFFFKGYGYDKWNDLRTSIGVVLAFAGLITGLVAKFGAWWNNR